MGHLKGEDISEQSVSLWKGSNLCRESDLTTSFSHRRFVGRQEVAVMMMAAVTRLTEVIYIDVNIEKLQTTEFDPLNPYDLRPSSRKIFAMRSFTYLFLDRRGYRFYR